MGQFRFRGEPVSLLAVVVNLFVSMGGYICALYLFISLDYILLTHNI